jgi:hypothetical protein
MPKSRSYPWIQTKTEMKKVSKSILKSFAFLELRKSRDLLQVYYFFINCFRLKF